MPMLRNTLTPFSQLTPDQLAELEAKRPQFEAERIEREREIYRQMREKTIAKRIDKSGIPEEYKRTANIQLCNVHVRMYLDELLQGGIRGLNIRGDSGVGKTFAACSILMEMAKRKSIYFTNIPNYLRETRSTYRTNATENESDVFTRYAECGVLVIDDLGKEVPKDTTLVSVWELIDARTADGLPTIFTTQYSGAELYERFVQAGDSQTVSAILSRLSLNHSIVLEGGDRRRRKAI